MVADFWLVLRWWGVLFLVGAAAWPLTRKLFRGWWDGGWLFSKAVGMAVVTWIIYAAGTVRIVPFTIKTIFLSILVLFTVGLLINIKYQISNIKYTFQKLNRENAKFFLVLFVEELFFFIALLFWSWIKAHEPTIRGLEKFMDFGFMQSILTTQYFPAPDLWYAGSSINYYYFGHIVTAVLTKLSGIDLAITFNLMLATLFALTLTMSFSIGKQLGNIAGGVLTAFLVTLAGNMQTIYAFTRGYTGDNVRPFWELGWKLTEGLATYWYANATRFIPYTIHEFPGYSFVVSDVHGHVVSIPFVLLSVAMLLVLFGLSNNREKFQISNFKFQIVFYGFFVGVLLMTNALDGPIYFALLVGVLVMQNAKCKIQNLKTIGIVGLVAFITSLPFLVHFKSFVSGIAVNCPPAFLTSSTEKCQHSPLWMILVLWGFFLYCGGWLVLRWIRRMRGTRGAEETKKLLLVFFFFSLTLIIFPELFYFKDIYPMHFRSNTMFKLGYQAFILFSIVSAYAIVKLLRNKLFLLFLLPQLFLVSIYPIFAVRSYFGELKTYEGLDGLGWMRREYPDDYAAIRWLNLQPERFAIVEADGDSYTDYNRFSAFTGNPTIIGWAVHEWLWRGGYDVVAPRREDVRKIYESDDVEETKRILQTYNAGLVVVGTLERQKFTNVEEWKFSVLGKRVFESGESVLYRLK